MQLSIVINSNFGRILQFLRHDDLLAEKCEVFLPHSHVTLSLGVNPFEFLDKVLSPGLESLRYPSVKIL